MDTLTGLMVIKTVAMCVQPIAMGAALIGFIVFMRNLRHNSPLEVKRRAFLKQMGRYEVEDRLRAAELQKRLDDLINK